MKFSHVAVALSVLATGCASNQSAPFHVYRSPLLAAQTPVPETSDREFDPARPGDYPESDGERLIADNDDGGWDQQVEATASPERDGTTAKNPRKKRLFSLAIGGREAEPSGSRDASGFEPRHAAAYVWKTFDINGVSLPAASRDDVAALWKACKTSGKTTQGPALPGDAVFFHNVFDANADGRNNDWYTHVGVVEKVRPDGAARVLSYSGGKVIGFWVDPKRPEELGDEDSPVNSRLRIPTPDDAPFTQYYAGQLFAGYCAVLEDRSQVVVMDSWGPGQVDE